MFINLQSTNKDFSFVIKKNPSSPPLCKSIRKGAGIGWFDNPQSYNLTFFESGKVVSFPKSEKEEFSYMYDGEFCDPSAAIALLNEFLRDTSAKDRSEKDIISHNGITISSVNLKRDKIISAFINHFPDYKFTVIPTEHWGKFVTLKVENEGYFQDLFYLVLILLVSLAIDNGRMFFIGKEDMIEKILLIMNKINAPYYIKFMFKVKCIHGKLFKKLKSILDTDEYDFVDGDTQQNRINFALEHISSGETVVDWGCGGGQYIKAVSNVADKYFGFDIDEDSLERAKKKALFIDNAAIFHADEEVDIGEVDSLICSEVIEHMPKDDAVAMIKGLISKFAPKKMIFTTPNKDFNVNYLLKEDEVRFPDHFSEMNRKDFEEFLLTFNGYNVEYFELGDKVNGVPCILGAVLERKNAQK